MTRLGRLAGETSDTREARVLSSGENVHVSVWERCKPGTGLPPVSSIPRSRAVYPCLRTACRQPWAVGSDMWRKQAKRSALPRVQVNPCPSVLPSGLVARQCGQLHLQAGHHPGSWGLRQAMGSPQRVRYKISHTFAKPSPTKANPL